MGLKRSPILRKRWPRRRISKARPRTANLARRERAHKATARMRDKARCRFPLCGCGSWLKDPMKGILTISHDKHKGMGGDPTGERSLPPGLIALCKWRHQDGNISRHAGNIRAIALTVERNDGPVAWEIQVEALVYYGIEVPPAAKRAANAATGWLEVARESEVQQLEPPTIWQRMILEQLAEMNV